MAKTTLLGLPVTTLIPPAYIQVTHTKRHFVRVPNKIVGATVPSLLRGPYRTSHGGVGTSIFLLTARRSKAQAVSLSPTTKHIVQLHHDMALFLAWFQAGAHKSTVISTPDALNHRSYALSSAMVQKKKLAMHQPQPSLAKHADSSTLHPDGGTQHQKGDV